MKTRSTIIAALLVAACISTYFFGVYQGRSQKTVENIRTLQDIHAAVENREWKAKQQYDDLLTSYIALAVSVREKWHDAPYSVTTGIFKTARNHDVNITDVPTSRLLANVHPRPVVVDP